ncbi:hypothetical protein A6R70_03490 [Agrobacterium rubi]|nr:hypothetical protein [Agrobacterium rubi]
MKHGTNSRELGGQPLLAKQFDGKLGQKFVHSNAASANLRRCKVDHQFLLPYMTKPLLNAYMQFSGITRQA